MLYSVKHLATIRPCVSIIIASPREQCTREALQQDIIQIHSTLKTLNMENTSKQPSPAGIMQIGTAFWASKILLSAIRFQLFTTLGEKEKLSGKEIKSLLGLQCTDRHLYDFLDTLTAFGFLQREGLLETASYSNTPDTNMFLDKKKPSYIGGILEMMNNRLYGFWGNLEEGLLSGLPQNETKRSEDFFSLIYGNLRN